MSQNIPTMLLTPQENEAVFGMLGRKCLTLASAVVQVHVASADGRRWTKRCVGVACLVKDNPQRSYFIRVYSLKDGKQVWEQELYSQFKYNVQLPYFHTFEADDCQAGLSFASDEEGRLFQEAMLEKLQRRHQRKERRNVQLPPIPDINAMTPNALPVHQARPLPVVPSAPNVPTTPSALMSGRKSNNNSSKKKKKFCKADIGMPSNFQHVGHVGWDPNAGFDTNVMDPQLKELFDSAGISESQLKDKETSKIIFDFIESHGGLEGVKSEMMQQTTTPSRTGPLPPTPPQFDTPQSSRGRNHNSRPLPSRPCPTLPTTLAPSPPPMMHQPPYNSRAVPPPPPPPSQRSPQPPPPPPQSQRPPPGVASPVAPPAPLAPPPPPPPPPPPANKPPPPGPPPLMQTEPSSQRGDGGDGGGGGGRRGALLDQIRQGISLKTAEPSSPSQSSGAEDTPGIAGALMKALEMRNKVIHSSDEGEDEEPEDDDDEWED